MKEFSYLLKRKDRAIRVFLRAKEDTVLVRDELHRLLDQSVAKVSEEQEKQRFLSHQASEVESTIERINKVLGV